MADTLPRPTDAELEILAVLLSIGPATLRQGYDVISRRRTPPYSTNLKCMQIMCEKGLVVRNQDQRAHVYEPAKPREWTQQQLAGHLLERAFSGSAKALLVGALSARRASKEEIAAMEKLLQEYRKERK